MYFAHAQMSRDAHALEEVKNFITKRGLMENLTVKTIREIANEMPAATRVFEEFKIDYCCGGRRNFNDACQFAGISPLVVSEKISAVLKNSADETNSVEKKSPSALVDYIVEKHHTFTRQEIGRLTILMEKVCYKHDKQHAELADLRKVFRALCDDLTAHMRKEEFVLFPFIKNLEMSEKRNLSVTVPPFATVQNPVRMMMTEHHAAGNFLREMHKITNNYNVPEAACPSFRALYFGLEELERDLHRHIHLENNILFPLAVELEQKVIFGK